MVLCQHVLSITTLTIISIFSVLIFLNFNSIPIVKVSGNSDGLPESIKYTINTLRLLWNTLHAMIRYKMNVSNFNLSHDLFQPISCSELSEKPADRCATPWRFLLHKIGNLENYYIRIIVNIEVHFKGQHPIYLDQIRYSWKCIVVWKDDLMSDWVRRFCF